jgi:predicted permease
MARDDSLVGRLDHLGVARQAEAEGLSPALAQRVADAVTRSGLPEDRRSEVYRELVSHFQDGLEAGRTETELLEAFGDGAAAGRLIGGQKRVVTPEAAGGSGSGDGLLTRLLRDVRLAARRLLARPGFTATALLSLALGIGANAAMFTLVNDLILRKPALPDPEQLVEIYMTGTIGPFNTLSYPDMEDLARATTDVFSAVGGTRLFMVSRDDADVPDRVVIEEVTPNFFQLLGVRPGLGRLIEPADAPAPGSGTVVVLTDSYWRRAYGADRGVVGRTIRLTGEAYTIIGVAPRDYPSTMRGIAVDLFVPVTRARQLDPTATDDLTSRTNQSTFVKARLRPGVSHEQARVALGRVAADFVARRVGAWQEADHFTLIPWVDVILWPPIDRILRPVAWMLMVVVGLVLVISCANLAAFLLARAVDRRKEFAVRLALGATRGRLISQLLVETVLTAMVAGVLGVWLARAALRLVLAADLPLPIPISFGLALDWRVLGFSVGISIVAGVLFGLAPALQATRFELASVIRDESGGGGRVRARLRHALVAGQVAVSLVLLVAAGLFVRSLDAVRSVDPGFGGRPAAMVWLSIPRERDVVPTVERLAQRVVELPGVETVGVIDNIHLNPLGTSSTFLEIEGVAPPKGRAGYDVDEAAIDTGFVAAVGLDLIRGRNFAATDRDSSPPVALVNQAFVDRYWPEGDAIGRRIRTVDTGPPIVVVGVVATARIRTLAEDPRPMLYLALAQRPSPAVWLIARTSGDAELLLPAMLRASREIEPDLFIFFSRTMKRHIETMSLPMKLGAQALAIFALLALVMASIGLYGTVSYAVAQRTKEVGIRLSLGADRGTVIRLLLWGGVRLVLIGVAVGLALALGLAQLIQGLLFGVRALDPLTFVVVPLVLVAVALLASWIPARRAGRVDPITALRAE